MSKEHIKISIIVPVYNTGAFLHKCLKSLQDQTLKNIEIICIDDCSTDNSVEIICNDFVSQDHRFSIYKNKEKKFASGSRNYGIEVAKGEYIAFVDSDDYVDLDYFERLYDNAKIYDADIAIGGIEITNTNTNTLIKKCDYTYECEYLTEKILPKIKEGVCWDKIYKASFLKNNDNIRFPENIVYTEDILFSYLVLSNCNKVVFTGGSFYRWQRRNSSISFSTTEEKRTNDTLKVLHSILDVLIKNNSSQDLVGISLNFVLPYLALYAFKNPKNKELFNEKLQKYYPLLKIS